MPLLPIPWAANSGSATRAPTAVLKTPASSWAPYRTSLSGKSVAAETADYFHNLNSNNISYGEHGKLLSHRSSSHGGESMATAEQLQRGASTDVDSEQHSVLPRRPSTTTHALPRFREREPSHRSRSLHRNVAIVVNERYPSS